MPVILKRFLRLWSAVVAFLTALVLVAESCLKMDPISWRKTDGIWNVGMKPRKFVESCECGLNFDQSFGSEKPWTLYLFANDDDHDNDKMADCVATIIASNLVATSHKCLIQQNKRLNVYDHWIPVQGSNIFPFKKVVVSRSKSNQGSESFEVERIIVNPHYALRASLRRFPLNDIALLKVKADFTSHASLRPICIPELESHLDLAGQEPEYYGFSRDSRDLAEVHDSLSGILFGEFCEQHEPLALDKVRQLCVFYDRGQKCNLPSKRGNPLVLHSADGNRAFLVGLSCRRDIKENRITEHFTNIIAFIKYIDYHANQQGSKWCRRVAFQLPKPTQHNHLRLAPMVCADSTTSYPLANDSTTHSPYFSTSTPVFSTDSPTSTTEAHPGTSTPPPFSNSTPLPSFTSSTPLPSSSSTFIPSSSVQPPSLTSSTYKPKPNRPTSGRAPGCICGNSSNILYKEKRWNLYVFVYSDFDNPDNAIVCPGTIITSNLIALSHQCLYSPEVNATNSLVEPSRVRVFNKKFLSFQYLEEYPVEKVILNPIFHPDSGYDDIALIKVGTDFTNHSYLTPVCIPEYELGLNLTGLEPQHYGLGTADQWQYVSEVRNSMDGLLFTLRCDQNLSVGFEEIDSLCMRYDLAKQGCMIPVEPGSPLMIPTKEGILFMIGMSYEVKWGKTDGYLKFSNIMRSILFIEEQAEAVDSTWCRQPIFLLPEPRKPKEIENMCGPVWPEWDNVDPPVTRDESLDCECGILNTASPSSRIIGGEVANPREFGWMTLLEFFFFPNQPPFPACGGAIINNRMILTAAHCIVKEDDITLRRSDDIVVVLKAHKRANDTEAIRVQVQSVFSHPGYTQGKTVLGTYDYDIALLVLKNELTFPSVGNGLRPICLPKLSKPIPLKGKNVTVAGWGFVDPEWTTFGAELKKLTVPIADLEYCRQISYSVVTDRVVCAGTLNKYQDAAQGDSGGPLILKPKKKEKYYQVGIVSFGSPVYIPDRNETELENLKQTFYTDVQQFIRYIDYHSDKVKAKWCKR